MDNPNPHIFDAEAQKLPESERITRGDQAVNECRRMIDECAAFRRQIDLMGTNPQSFGVSVRAYKRMGWQLMVKTGGVLGEIKGYYRTGTIGQVAFDLLCKEAESTIGVGIIQP